MIVAGIGSRKGVCAAEVLAAVDTALAAHGIELSGLSALATTDFKKDEAGIFEAGRMLGIEVRVVSVPLTRPPLRSATLSPKGEEDGQSRLSLLPHGEKVVAQRPDEGEIDVLTLSSLSLEKAGTPSVSESAALAAAGPGARLLGPRIATGRVTCALAEASR